jgi:hypothetical protein
MPDFSVTEWTSAMEWAVAIIAFLVLGGLIYWVIGLVPTGRLMRCPETGTVTFVEIGRASPGDGTEPRVTVQRCELWPEHNECGRGCLARHAETTSGFRIGLRALRPFKRQ